MITIYHLEQHDLSVTFEVDSEKINEEMLTACNDFFINEKYRLAAYDGDLTSAVLGLIGAQVLLLGHAFETVESIIRLFDWDVAGGGQEGMPKIDGSEGIKLIDFDFLEFDAEEFTITKNEAPTWHTSQTDQKARS